MTIFKCFIYKVPLPTLIQKRIPLHLAEPFLFLEHVAQIKSIQFYMIELTIESGSLQ